MSWKKRLQPRRLPVYLLALVALWAARPTAATLLIGLVPILAGEALRVWATGHLYKNDALTVSGPYAYLRHPLYLGTLLIAAGFAIMAATPLALAALCIVVLGYFGYYMPYKNRIEGARLEAAFGDSFRRYAVAVPRLVPRFYAYVPLGGDARGVVRWQSDRFADNNETGTAAAVVFGVLALTARWAWL